MKNFKSYYVVKSTFFFLAFFSLFFFNSCKKLIDSVDEPDIPGASIETSKAILAPENIRATQGAKQKITIDWDNVDGAVYYYIYYALNANDDFVQLAETDKDFYEDKVGAGATIYYKIRAEKVDGEISEFSKTIKGTTLAVPTICDGVFDENEATIYWYMQNARDERTGESNYEDELQFVVTCKNEATGEVVEEQQLDGNQDHYTFKNLESNCSYLYSVSAFLLSDQTATEDSPEVSASTLLAFTPRSPEFTVSEGTFNDKIELSIILPPMVQVNTITDNSEGEQVTVNYPLYFKVERKLNEDDRESSWKNIADIYYDGTTVPPNAYGEYNPGKDITWVDNTGLTAGVKYDYRIKSYTDINYSQTIGSSYKENKGAKEYTEPRCGWICAPLGFYIKQAEYETDSETKKIKKVWFGFTATWNDLGKAGNYKFALKQERIDINSDPNGEPMPNGTTWVKNGDSTLFNSLEAINNLVMTFDISTDEKVKAQEGYYRYELFIVPSNSSTAADGATRALTSVKFGAFRTVSDNNTQAESIIQSVVGGYKYKAEIIFKREVGVYYSITRYCKETGVSKVIPEAEIERQLKEEYGEKVKYTDNGYDRDFYKAGEPKPSEQGYDENNDPNCNSEIDGSYKEIKLEPGKTYEYTLYSRKRYIPTPSYPHTVETLGMPELDFSVLAYTSITVTMPAVTGAERYTAEVGSKKLDFADAVTDNGFTVTKDGENKFEIKIDNPDNYNDATEAGKPVDFKVTAYSAVDSCEGNVETRLLGPAYIGLEGSEVTGVQRNSIKVKWKVVPGAKGYAVLRTIPAVGTEDPYTDVYFIDTDGNVSVNTGEFEKTSSAIVVTPGETEFTLVDNQTESEINQKWNNNQERIAWGLEYTYKVFPVLENGDADEDYIKSIYIKNFDKIGKSGYTYGYGLDIKATKAEYSDKIVLSWVRPASSEYGGLSPTIYYKNPDNNDSDWKKATVVSLLLYATNNTFDINVSILKNMRPSGADMDNNDYRDCRLRFIIDYNQDSSKNELDSSYIKYLDSKKDKDNEYDDCGYVFAMPTSVYPATELNGYEEKFEEIINWKLYDGAAKGNRTKKAGDNMDSDPYTLYVKNLNNSSEWWPVATFDKNGKMTKVVSDWYKVNVESPTPASGSNDVKTTITPEDIGTAIVRPIKGGGNVNAYGGMHNGLLKVQRDYKHYYRIGAKRKVSSSATEPIETFTDDIVTYRKITGDELVKGITLIVADALYRCGIPKGKGENLGMYNHSKYTSGDTGVFSITHRAWKDAVTYGTHKVNSEYEDKAVNYTSAESKDYKHAFERIVGNQSNKFVSAWTINIKPVETGNDSSKDNTLYASAWTLVEVKHEINLPSYNGYVRFHVGTEGKNGNRDASFQYSHSGSSDTELIVINNFDSNNTNFADSNVWQTVGGEGTDPTKMYEWFPYDLGTAHGDGDKSLNKSFPLYNNDWWLDRGKPSN